jgi:hypothetical protein
MRRSPKVIFSKQKVKEKNREHACAIEDSPAELGSEDMRSCKEHGKRIAAQCSV